MSSNTWQDLLPHHLRQLANERGEGQKHVNARIVNITRMYLHLIAWTKSVNALKLILEIPS